MEADDPSDEERVVEEKRRRNTAASGKPLRQTLLTFGVDDQHSRSSVSHQEKAKDDQLGTFSVRFIRKSRGAGKRSDGFEKRERLAEGNHHAQK